MKIPAFVNLKKFISEAERHWLLVAIEAMLGDRTVFIRTHQGDVVEGYLAVKMPNEIRVFFEDLRGRVK